jgi:hypothetical protein
MFAVITTASILSAQGAPTPDRQRTEREADSAYAAKNYRQAAALFDRLTRIDSTVPRWWLQLGMSAALTQDYATGARAFERASLLRAGPVAAYNAGAMFARLGQTDSAFAWLSRAVRTGFSDTATLSKDDDLASIRDDARFARIRHDASVAPAPCRDDPNYRRFDFWVGNWKVTTPGGQQVGTSHVDVVSGGCALLENWRDMRGSEGKSLNTFDPATGGWRQFWVGQGGGTTDYSESEWHGSSVTFTARTHGTNGRPDFVQRLTFTPLEGGVVRQFGEASADGGKTWPSSYDFHYHPVK